MSTRGPTGKTQTRVIDFGVACTSTAAGAATTRGNSGTPVYKAPELLADDDEPNSFMSDVCVYLGPGVDGGTHSQAVRASGTASGSCTGTYNLRLSSALHWQW